jgi:epoxyqueuosine reductase QueG
VTGKTERLKGQIKRWGASIVGVADLTSKGVREALSGEFSHFTRAVSMAIHCDSMRLSLLANDQGGESEQILGYMEENQTAVDQLNLILKHLKTEFRMRRFKYFILPPITNDDERRFSSSLFHLFPHKMAATCAGLGWIGKNGMLVNSVYGPNLIWATILTNAPLEPTSDQIMESKCEECTICVTACPASAVKGVNWVRGLGAEKLVDLKACAGQMEYNVKKFGRPVCGVCFMSCPYGTKEELRAAN